MAKILQALGNAVKTGTANVLSGLDRLAKNASSSSNLISSTVGSLIDAIIPDNIKDKMVSAAERDGVTKTAEVEKTVQSLAIAQGITDEKAIADATKALTTSIASESGTGITNAESGVKVNFFARAWAFMMKYKYVTFAVLAFLVYYLFFNKNGKRLIRKYVGK